MHLVIIGLVLSRHHYQTYHHLHLQQQSIVLAVIIINDHHQNNNKKAMKIMMMIVDLLYLGNHLDLMIRGFEGIKLKNNILGGYSCDTIRMRRVKFITT
jgi:hypothetical protein